ncbi:MAG: alpha/beta hydrolase, partial [Lachnospiraceae bacterium]|nr:alpha/beta hydrolase [Lachnospiraceae bacterium]
MKMLKVKKKIKPQSVSFGNDRQQYFLYYEPKNRTSDKVIVWVHGGGWNAGSPKLFDFVGQCVAGNGYRFLSLGYRLSPKNKYPCQIEDVCGGYKAAIAFLNKKGIDTSKIVISGPSAGAHLSAILC